MDTKIKTRILIYRIAQQIYRVISPNYNREYIRLKKEIKKLKPHKKTALYILDANYAYNEDYFSANQFEEENKWADQISEKIFKVCKPKSVIDVGCGRGFFLRYFFNKGIKIAGLEGSKSAFKKMVVPKNFIKHQDLRFPLEKIKRKYDYVITFEVAEHIEREFAAIFIYNLTKLSDKIVFTAFPPGEIDSHPHHPNEQPIEYWETIFAFFGFKPDDKKNRLLKKELIGLHLPRNLRHYANAQIYVKK